MKRPSNTRWLALAWTGAALVAAAAALGSLYTVGQGQQALVLRLGQPVATVGVGRLDDPGLKTKLPFIDTAVLFDKRDQLLETTDSSVVAADQAQLGVDALMIFTIADPLRFYRSLGGRSAADGLRNLLGSSLREGLSSASTQQITADPGDALALKVRDIASRQAQASGLGIAVHQVLILSVALPKPAYQTVVRRMQSAHQQEASRIRAQGEQQKREIIAEADKQVAVLRGTAVGQAEQIRGEGEAKRDAILAQAYGRDPEFARFYRTMQAYQSALGSGDTTMVLSPESQFLRDFTKTPGADK